MLTRHLHSLACIVAIGASLLVSSSAFAQSNLRRIQEIFERSQGAIVKIRVTGLAPDGSRKENEGTGFFVGANRRGTFLITALHVIGSSETDQNKNPDWKVEHGIVTREIKIESLDNHGSLVTRKGEVYVIPNYLSGVDLSVLMISQRGFPTLLLATRKVEDRNMHNTMLLSFQKQKDSLTMPFTLATGQLKGVTYVTDKPTRDGESGAPWIDIDSGMVVAVASKTKNGPVAPSYESTPVTWIKPLLATLAAATPSSEYERPDAEAPPAAKVQDPKAIVQPSEIIGPSDLDGLDLIYFERSSDRGVISDALNRAQLKFRPQIAEFSEKTNVVTCGSDKGLGAAKKLANFLLNAGIEIRGIAPQFEPKARKLTIEYYPQYSKQPVLTPERLAEISTCPQWSEVLSSYIKVTNNCEYGSIDVYLRYFHPLQEKWITAAKYGLGPDESWTVLDADKTPVGSGRPYVLAKAVTSRLSQYSDNQDFDYQVTSDYIEPRTSSADLQSKVLDTLPNHYFKRTNPVTRYGCPRGRGSTDG